MLMMLPELMKIIYSVCNINLVHNASNHYKKDLEVAKLAYTNKIRQYITSQKLNSYDFLQILILLSTKVNLLPLL